MKVKLSASLPCLPPPRCLCRHLLSWKTMMLLYFVECRPILPLLLFAGFAINSQSMLNRKVNFIKQLFLFFQNSTQLFVDAFFRVGVRISNSTLHIRSVKYRQQGDYQCTATNRLGETRSPSVSLQVQCKSDLLSSFLFSN